jgi:glycosyltransferase 2 family protein
VRRTGVWLILLSIVLSLAVPLAYGGITALRTLQDLPAAAFALLLVMAMLSWVCSGARLRLLAHALGVHLSAATAVSTIVACEFAAVTTPLGGGSLPTHVLLLSRRGLSAGRTIAIMAMDRVMDLIFFATALPFAFAAYGLDSGHGDLRHWGLIAGTLLLTGLGLLYALVQHHRSLAVYLGHAIHLIPGLKSKRRRLARMFIQFHNSVRLLFKMGRGPLALLYGLCMSHWLIRYSILPLLLWVTNHAVPWSYLFVVQGLALFIGQLSMLPGGGGGVELALSMLLRPYLTPAVTAATLLGWRFVTFHWSLLAGAPVFLWLMGRRSARLVMNATLTD